MRLLARNDIECNIRCMSFHIHRKHPCKTPSRGRVLDTLSNVSIRFLTVNDTDILQHILHMGL